MVPSVSVLSSFPASRPFMIKPPNPFYTPKETAHYSPCLPIFPPPDLCTLNSFLLCISSFLSVPFPSSSLSNFFSLSPLGFHPSHWLRPGSFHPISPCDSSFFCPSSEAHSSILPLNRCELRHGWSSHWQCSPQGGKLGLAHL